MVYSAVFGCKNNSTTDSKSKSNITFCNTEKMSDAPKLDSSRRPPWIVRKLKKRIRIITWLPKYNTDYFISDIIAGITVGLTVMPQALAYAALAGLEPQYGLYSAFVGCFVYAIFGSCRDITIGPTALMALMTYQQVVDKNPDFAVLLCFLAGIVQFIMCLLRLGVLVDFISIPVTVGFTSATSVIIAVSQLKGLLGLQFKSSGFLNTIAKVYGHINETRLADCILGFSCIVILLLLRRLKNWSTAQSSGKKLTTREKIISKAIWLISTSRNAIIVICSSLIAWYFDNSTTNSDETDTLFILTGRVRSGLPTVALPPFQTIVGNQTYNLLEMCHELGTSILLVPIIAVLGNVAIAKAFASGDSVDATQELLTLSLSNIFGSFVSSMPITGSFSRSAVNHASGVKTPMGGVYTGILVLLALTFLTPYFYYIPKASLAAVIISAVIFMIEYEVVKPMWKSSRKDLVPTFVTFVLCLAMGVEYGILLGVAINILILLYPSARPTIQVEKKMTSFGTEYLLVTPGNSLYFPAVDFIRASVGKAGVKLGSCQLPVIVDCRYILGADFTAAKGIAALIDDYNKRKQMIYFFRPREDVIAVFKGAALEDFQYVTTYTELDYLLYTKKCESKEEEMKLLPSHKLNGTVNGVNGLNGVNRHANGLNRLDSIEELTEIRTYNDSPEPLTTNNNTTPLISNDSNPVIQEHNKKL